jgi:hypothetical protein
MQPRSQAQQKGSCMRMGQLVSGLHVMGDELACMLCWHVAH